MRRFDGIVLGAGGVGSAALYHLARRGLKVLGLDRFHPPHDRGSSHGETRVIRLAYFEHPDYVPLLRRAYELWAELEAGAGERLYHECGLLEVGPQDGVIVPGVRAAAAAHGLEVEELSPAEAMQRYGGVSIPPDRGVIYERRAGYLRVEACIAAHLTAAQGAGASVHGGEAVVGWRPDGAGVVVQTSRSAYRASFLVVTAGAWAGPLLGGLGVDLRVVRKPLFWFGAPSASYAEEFGFPCFFFEEPDGSAYYGFPARDADGLKVAEHSGGRPVTDPLALDRGVDPGDEAAVRGFLDRYLPGANGPRTRHAACMYTLSPDEHFLVDRHPEHPQVVFAAGLSGHGFKLASTLGETLADLAADGACRPEAEFLGLRRLGVV
jgi:monomeric sarcosine oxidase